MTRSRPEIRSDLRAKNDPNRISNWNFSKLLHCDLRSPGGLGVSVRVLTLNLLGGFKVKRKDQIKKTPCMVATGLQFGGIAKVVNCLAQTLSQRAECEQYIIKMFRNYQYL